MTSRAAALAFALAPVLALASACGPKHSTSEGRVRQVEVYYEGPGWTPCRKKKTIRRLDGVLRKWEYDHKTASRPLKLTIVDGATWTRLIPVTLPNGAVVQIPTQVSEQFYMGAGHAKVAAGGVGSDLLPGLYHLLLHVNLVAQNVTSGADLADMNHNHVNWPFWDSFSRQVASLASNYVRGCP